jgi:hypothetical protein
MLAIRQKNNILSNKIKEVVLLFYEKFYYYFFSNRLNVVASNQQNIHILHTLLYDLKKIMRKYYCWGRPLGSTRLWEQHLRTMERICQMANRIEIKQVDIHFLQF